MDFFATFVQNIAYKNTTISINIKTRTRMKRIYALLSTIMLLSIFAVRAECQTDKGNAAVKLDVVVIDAGHGGKDAGCVSRDQKTYEKNITLDIAKRLRDKIQAAYPDVTVVMTRDTDVFVELEGRAVKANKAGADLFISIHVNSVEKGTTANGYSIHCLGQSKKKGNDLYSKNLDLVKRENSVIMLEDNQAAYQGFDPNDPQSSIIFSLMHNAHLENSLAFAQDVEQSMGNTPIRTSRGVSQDPFWVLWRTAMPSVLIEVGFITNPDDLSTMRQEEGRDGIARNIFNAFVKFKSRYDGSTAAAESPSKPSAPQKPVEVHPKTLYGCQILVSANLLSSKDSYFAGYTNIMVAKSGKYYKYYAEVSESQSKSASALAKIRKKIPDAFVAKLPADAVALKP